VFDTGNTGTGTAHADTSSVVYDRAAAGSTYQARNRTGDGTITLSAGVHDNVRAIFKDSSSANSIIHAVVSGGGVHHTKAVTLSSDGTNGTSTTDHNGNIIYWCGSNSSVTFANSSSFSGYGNTSIRFDKKNKLTTPANADWDLAANFNLSWWAYIPSTMSANNHGIMCARGSGYEGLVVSLNNSAKLQFVIDDGGTSPWHTNYQSETTFKYDSWNFFEIHRGSEGGGIINLSINGLNVYRATNSTDFYYSGTHALLIGTQDSSDAENVNLYGYLQETRVIKGEDAPTRFYLGNQAPPTGETLTTFKYATFNGTDEYYTRTEDDFGLSSSQGTILAWVKLFPEMKIIQNHLQSLYNTHLFH
jgi:hypothetical protein